MSAITEVEAIALRAASDGEDFDSSSETLVVRLVDDEGNTGIGEADAPAEAAVRLVLMNDAHAWSRGLRSMLIGRDPFERESLWHDLYEGTVWHGRRGLGIHVLSAVDVALHDLVGKELGRPVYQLLGGKRRERLTPYATLWPGAVAGRTIDQMMDAISASAKKALKAGFRAAKMEVFFGDLVDDRELVACIREGRRLLGEDTTLMVDFGYRWKDWREALWVLNRLEDCNLYFAEATLQHDDLVGHSKLASRCETRVGGAEMAGTIHECREWLERGSVDVVQPDIGRCGGLIELRKIAQLAELYGALVVPHAWKTGITAAASLHFQAATPNAPFIEMLSPAVFSSPLRAELTQPEPEVEEGTMALPTAPGLGIELVEETVKTYRVPA
ncbi:MAG: mandelate racemase/muconate lactonizing enzyme family protein [Actinomycetota bacterium]|nr:mandelate racemase/muconate lactonizing enzyme family protein [Actinomycetota bacterium]